MEPEIAGVLREREGSYVKLKIPPVIPVGPIRRTCLTCKKEGEQKMNAVMLVAEGAALRAGKGGDGVVGREEIPAAVVELMEGEKGKTMREKVERLKKAGEKALVKGGSSYRGLAEVVKTWINMRAI